MALTSAAAPLSAETLASIAAYSLCSGTLLLLNKVVLHLIPSSPLVTALQCLFCLTCILGCSFTCGAPQLSALTPPVLRAYLLYGVLFVGGIYSNMRSLQAANVDTVIVFRASVPLLVAVGDYTLLGREAPTPRSWGAMVLIVVGCAVYCAVDSAFAMQGVAAYAWVLVYVAFMALEMLLGKQITSSLDVTLGTSVLLTNAVGLLPFLAIGAATGELQRGLDWAHFSPTACAALLASCVLSAGIGFSSWWCRSLVSATTFTVVGVVNKVLTVLLNILVWEKHSSWVGTLFLFVVRLVCGGGCGWPRPCSFPPFSPPRSPSPPPARAVPLRGDLVPAGAPAGHLLRAA
jgi:drug/metabolite transporter (DMT)-like permease